jgi:Integrase core domain
MANESVNGQIAALDHWAHGEPLGDKPTAPASLWQNGFAERLIGSIRRECVDHFVVLGEAHLRRILQAYARYYNDIRTHRSLDKDAPVSRPVQRTGIISSHVILGGLHHHYVRV